MISPLVPSSTTLSLHVIHSLYLMHCEVREEDDKVLLHSDDQTSVSLVSSSDHLHVVSHTEVFTQLMSRKF